MEELAVKMEQYNKTRGEKNACLLPGVEVVSSGYSMGCEEWIRGRRGKSRGGEAAFSGSTFPCGRKS